jgi:nucleoside-diphosphate-sugar epimerase
MVGAVEVVRGDLTSDDMARAAEGASAVFHLAGLTRAATDAEFLWANAEGTRAVALGAARAGARLVYVSSLAAAGPGTPERPRTESDPLEPITAYGRSKLEGEKRVHEVAGLMPLEFSIIRPAGVYGPGDKDFLFAFQAAKLGVFPILGDPNRAYTLVHVADLVGGIIAAAEHPNAIGQTYFMGHPETVRWSALLSTLAVLFDKPYRPLPLPSAALEVAAQLGEAGKAFGRVGLINKSRQRDLTAPGWVCDSSAIARDLGVTATTALEPGFRATAEWYKNARWI